MKQILQNLKTGETQLEEIPTPSVQPGYVLIQTRSSVVSAGTERMLVDFGKANYIDKARQQPDKVKQVIDKVKTDGLMPTFHTVRTKLDQPLPLGYSNAGVVIEVGDGVTEFSSGDRVVSNGPHAEVVSVPKNLCAKIPDEVSFDDAAFTVVSSIALQGIRLAQPTLGESFVVIGLGLIGLLTVQLLKAHGCRVLATDFEEHKLDLASQFGAETVNLSSGIDPVSVANRFSNDRGIDGVLITASTKSSDPVRQAANMCRKRGRIVLIGVTGLELSRADFYEKEISFQVSCSYGPGRYDPDYEEKGQDYPIGFVRWTEQRNFEAVLDMMAAKKLNLEPLITNRFDLNDAEAAYKTLSEDKKAIGIVLNYDARRETTEPNKQVIKLNSSTTHQVKRGQAVVGVIGAGSYTNATLLPAMKKTDARFKSIASIGGVNGVHVGKRFGFEQTTTDANTIIEDEEINSVIITTRHDTHATYVEQAMKAGKHVFVEKPLCLTRSELENIRKVSMNHDQQLMIGFNRRFAPHIQKMKQLLNIVVEPKTLVMTVNAGEIPSDHWTQDPKIGGGRILGEAVHFIDLLRFLVGHSIVDVSATMLGEAEGMTIREDKMTFTLSFADGSIGTVHYFANGHRSYPKEKLDVFAGGKVLSLNNFKSLKGYGWRNFKRMKLWNQDKGHKACIQSFIDAVNNGLSAAIGVDEIFEVTETSFKVVELASRV